LKSWRIKLEKKGKLILWRCKMTETGRDLYIRTIDREKLPRLSDIKIDTNLSSDEKARSFLEQLGGRYCYADGDMVVAFGYAETDVTLTEKLAMYARTLG
jgi:hypothetical protein